MTFAADPSQKTAQTPAPNPADDTPHLLVVDDDRRIRALLSRFLRAEGYRVSTAETAQDARAKLEGLNFDLLVLDVMMPGESGFDFARTLRASSTVPILLLTARGEEVIRLTDREREMLRILTASPGETVPRQALAGNGGAVSERTVDVQVNR